VKTGKSSPSMIYHTAAGGLTREWKSMARAKFDELERGIAETRAQVQEINSTQEKIDERLGTVLGDSQMQTIDVNIDDQDFKSVVENEDKLQGNIASLVYGLDEITQTFGSEFKSMSESTFMEKVTGIFSRRRAEEMKTSRIRNADIRSNLNNLIEKSEVIRGLLEEQLAVIDDRLDKSKTAQADVLDRAQTTARQIEETDAQLDELAPQISAIDAQIADATGEALKALQADRAELANTYNEATAKKQELVATQQSFERYGSIYANYVESLAKQKAAQQTLISKLNIDTEQRTIMYDALVESLRTSAQQNIGHRIDDVGRETDAQAEAMITQIGISSENRIVSMMEAHEIYMKRTADIRQKADLANAEFARRFGKIVEQVESGKYVE
jgi:chromosome segregation ATPase